MMVTYPKMYLYHRLVKAKMFIDSHYHLPIDLDNISDEAFFSKFHFIREFKRIFGKTPRQYRIYVRVEKAKILLQEGMQVNDVCSEVGFESISSFTSLFKKITGKTPALYKSQELLKQQMVRAKPLMFIPGCYVGKFGWKGNSNFQESVV